jgi:serine/threonine protein kinase
MSNDEPPRACLADFGFMAMVLDPSQPMSRSVQLEGGTMTFMSPELLVPSKFNTKDSVPTPQADIYAFGLVTFQVCEQDRRLLLLLRLYRSSQVIFHSVGFGTRN